MLNTISFATREEQSSVSSKDSGQTFHEFFDFLSFDFPAIVIFQWQVNLILFHAAREDLGRCTLLAGNFLNGIRFRLRIFMSRGKGTGYFYESLVKQRSCVLRSHVLRL